MRERERERERKIKEKWKSINPINSLQKMKEKIEDYEQLHEAKIYKKSSKYKNNLYDLSNSHGKFDSNDRSESPDLFDSSDSSDLPDSPDTSNSSFDLSF